MNKNPLFLMWARNAMEEIRQGINANEKELRSIKEKKSTLALALKKMIAVDKKAVKVYADSIKEEEEQQ